MTSVNEYNFQIREQDKQLIVSSNADEAVPAVLLNYVQKSVTQIYQYGLPEQKACLQQMVNHKSFKVVSGGRIAKQVSVNPGARSSLQKVFSLTVQSNKSNICSFDCPIPTDEKKLACLRKIEECFKRKADPTKTTPLLTRTTPTKKSSGGFFEWIATVFGSCLGRAPKKIKNQVVQIAHPSATISSQSSAASATEIQRLKPLPLVPAPDTSSSRSNPVGMQGIQNEQNTCFINAVFQMIMNDTVLTESLFDAYLEEVQKKDRYQAGYQCFINAVINYQKGQPVSLKDLRILLNDISSKPGVQGDASEILIALLRPVLDHEKYRHLFTSLGTERKWVRFTPPKNAEQNYQQILSERSKKGLSVMPPNGIMPPQYDIGGLIIPLQVPANPIAGQNLLDHSFTFQRVPRGDPTAFTGGWYQIDEEKLSLERVPERLMIKLKRFNSDGSKINTSVDMPENLTLQGQNYRLKSIAVHISGHYYSLVRKESGWFEANDDRVSPAQSENLRHALSQGYLYFYERV